MEDGANNVAHGKAKAQQDAPRTRRRFSDKDKLRILEAADRCSRPGELGLLLRREGIYSSHLATWRRWRRRAHPELAQSQQPPTESQLRHDKARLEREVVRLRLKLEHADKLLALQKKMAEMMEAMDREDLRDDGGDGRSA
jgi:transposase